MLKKMAKNFAEFNEVWVWGSPLAYLPLFLLLIICFVPAYQESARVSEKEQEILLSHVPDMNAADILREVECLADEMMQTDASAPATSPDVVFILVDHSLFLEKVLQKSLYKFGRMSNPQVDELVKAEAKLLTHVGAQKPQVYTQRVRLQKQLIDRFQGKTREFDARLAAWREKHPLDERPRLPSETWRLAKEGYLLSVLVMFCFFVMRLYRKDQIVWVETPRILLFSILWPVGLFVYPTDKTKMEQLRQALEVLCYSQSIIMSALGFWGVGPLQVAKAQVSAGQTKGKLKEKDRRFEIGKPVFGAELYHGQGLPSEEGLMLAPWYSLKSHLGPINVSQFGFVELGEKHSQLFTNHAATFTHDKVPFAYRTEAGGSPKGAFWSGGPVIVLSRTPGVRKIVGSALQSLSVARLGRIRGSGPGQEIFFSWATKKVALGFGDISFDGFYRIRPGAKSNVGQPRLIFRPKNWKIATINYEMWWVGYKPTHRIGLEFTF